MKLLVVMIFVSLNYRLIKIIIVMFSFSKRHKFWS